MEIMTTLVGLPVRKESRISKGLNNDQKHINILKYSCLAAWSTEMTQFSKATWRPWWVTFFQRQVEIFYVTG